MEANLPQPEEGFRALGGGLYIVYSEAGLEAALGHDKPDITPLEMAEAREDFLEKFNPAYPCYVTVGTLNQYGAYYATYAKA